MSQSGRHFINTMSALIKPALLRGSKLILRSLELDLQLNEEYLSSDRIGHECQGCPRAIDVVLHRGRPAQPDRPDNFSVHLNGKSSTPCCHPGKRGDAGQKRRVALDKVEK